MYGLAEGVLGDLLTEMAARPGVFLATKVLRGGLDQMQRSAQLLRTQVIDLMQCTIWWTDVLNWRRYAV
jgi:aryl-alcohol dehydrogenase-like predicted oxidoreductase